MNFTLSEEGINFLNILLQDTGQSPEELFRKALGLYRLSIDAHRQGKCVGTAATPDVLEIEFVDD